MKVLFSLFFSLTLFANESLIDLYQKEGIASIEKRFDQVLATKAYWDNRIKDINTSFGYFESINHLLTCDKSQHSLKLYSKENNSSFTLKKDFSAFVGKKTGDKQREGDLKTPIGVYKILQKLNNVDPFYGPLAFVTSYPNAYDKIRGKNGSGIWVHGLPINQKRDDYTKGCIAINNTHLKSIESEIDFHKVLVYIDQKKLTPVSKTTLSTLLANLYQWRKAWKESDLDRYISYYDPSFKRLDGLTLERFIPYKRRIFAKNEYKQILFSEINIIAYPMVNKTEVYLISFHEKYTSMSYRFNGEKELYVQLQDNHFRILAEK